MRDKDYVYLYIYIRHIYTGYIDSSMESKNTVVFCTWLRIMLLLFILIAVATGIPLGSYNVTFPCGPPVNNQRCRFPVEFCDTNQGSCSFCNEDICREQDSDPSCRAFCLGWYLCIITLIKICKSHVIVK